MFDKICKIVGLFLLLALLVSNCFMYNMNATNSEQLKVVMNHIENDENVCLDCVESAKIIGDLEEKVDRLSVRTEEDKIVFIGNSLFEGLRLNAGSDAVFMSKGGINVEGLKSGIYDTLTHYDCEKVIVGLGTNEIGVLTKEEFIKSYQDLVSHIRGINPDSKIVIMSIPPVTRSRSESDARYNNENIRLYNTYVEEVCELDKELIYFDNSPFFTDELNTEWSGDGLHYYNRIYQQWYKYIMENVDFTK